MSEVERLRDRVAELEMRLAEVTGAGTMQDDPEVRAAKLNGMPARILVYLKTRGDMGATHDQILAALYGYDDPPAQKILSVYICKARQAFRDAGLGDPFRSLWGSGYAYVPEDRRAAD